MIAICAMTNDSSIILLDHVLEEEFERCRDVRVVACGLYELLPDHRVCFFATRLPYDTVNGEKQRRVSIKYDRLSEGCAVLEGQTHELTNLEKYSVMTFSAVTFCKRSR